MRYFYRSLSLENYQKILQIIIQYFVKIICDRNILEKFDGIIIFNRNIPKKYLNKKSKKIIENFRN